MSIKELTKKLPYDIPVTIALQFKEDCKKMREPATKVLIELMKEYHEKVEKINV